MRRRRGATKRPKIAIAHDYLTQRGGAERVVLVLAEAFPDAPIYTTLYDPDGTFPEFRGRDIRTSWGNRVGWLRRHHRAALPLLPLLSNSIQIDADVVIASSSGWAHGFPTTGRRVVYCYSPARWLYQPDVYLGTEANPGVRLMLRMLAPGLKRWDRRRAAGADRYLAISTVVQQRIADTYGLDSEVVPAPVSLPQVDQPEPVDDPWFQNQGKDGYLLTVSRLLPYKNVEAVIRGAGERPLVVVGRGPDRERLRALVGDNVLMLEGLTDAQMAWLYDGCLGLVAASHEDFGLTPLEAASHGKPSAVLRAGGYLDTMVEAETAVFFDEPTEDAIRVAILRLIGSSWSVGRLRTNAARFSPACFTKRIETEVGSSWE